MEQFLIDNIPIYIILLPFIGFAVFWVVVMHLIAYGSGWKRAAELYAMSSTNEFPNDKITFGTVQVNGSSYNGVMSIAIDSMGIFLRPILSFRPGHKTLHIPRGMVSEIEKNPLNAYWQKLSTSGSMVGNLASTVGSLVKDKKLLTDSYKVTVGNPSVINITFVGKAVQRRGHILEERKESEW